MNIDWPSVVALFTLLCLLIAWMIWAMRSTPGNLLQKPIYFLAYLFVRLLWRSEVVRKPSQPIEGGAVIIANHSSSVDPFLIQFAFDRWIHWMIAREFAKHKIYGILANIGQAVSTNRGGIDTSSTRQAIRLASQGGLVGLFPEGRINMTEAPFLAVRPGAAVIAQTAGVPIVPCYVADAPYDRFPHSPATMAARVKIYIGDPIMPTPKADESNDEAARETILLAMREMALLAGHPEFQPHLAGRKWKPSREQTLREMDESLKRRKRRAKR